MPDPTITAAREIVQGSIEGIRGESATGTMRGSHVCASSGRPEIVSGARVLLHAVEHLREHMGHAQPTRQLWDQREG